MSGYVMLNVFSSVYTWLVQVRSGYVSMSG
jgi:hypothetical protein